MQLYARDLMTKNFDTIHRDATVELAIRKILNAKVRPTGHKTISLMVVDDDHALVGTISMHYVLYHLRPFSLLFAAEDADLLAVVTDETNRRVIGRLSEAHALRRYGEELEKRNRAFVER